MFATTHWSVVLAAGQADAPRRRAALEILCRTYWKPLYAWLRSQGREALDAQDLTQAFFLHLLTGEPFVGLSPDKGKFRSFLLKALKNFLADEHDRATAAKRGGGQVVIPLDDENVERHYLEENNGSRTPEAVFDRQWGLTVLDSAFRALQQEYVAAGKTAQFKELSPFLSAGGGAAEYASAAASLGMTAGAVAVAVHRLRGRYGDCLRAEIAQTVRSPAELEEEMRYLLELVCQ